MIAVSREPIRNKYGKILGWLETDKDNVQQIKEFSGKILGKYDPRDGWTRDFYGKMMGKGNLLLMFLDFDK